MDCPRCGTELTTISIDGGSAAAYCDHCGFANIETSPAPAEPESETWDDAIERFHDTATAAVDTNTNTNIEETQESPSDSTHVDDNSDMTTDSDSRSHLDSDGISEDTNDVDESETNNHTDSTSNN